MSNVSRFIGNERGDGNYQENDGCPTEVAVLKRFWREMQAARSQDEEVSDLVEFLDNENVPCEDNLKFALSIAGRVKQYVRCKTEELREQVEKLTKELSVLKTTPEVADASLNDPVVGSSIVLDIGEMKRLIELVKAEENEAIIAAANALENIASTSSSTRIRRVANEALTAIRARRK